MKQALEDRRCREGKLVRSIFNSFPHQKERKIRLDPRSQSRRHQRLRIGVIIDRSKSRTSHSPAPFSSHLFFLLLSCISSIQNLLELLSYESLKVKRDTQRVGFLRHCSSLSGRKLRRDHSTMTHAVVAFSAAFFSSSSPAFTRFCTKTSSHLQMMCGNAPFSALCFYFNS